MPKWKYIPPPFDQKKPITLSAPPLGARYTGSASPYKTIQVIGRSRKGVPKKVDIDLGWADITVINGTKIVYRKGGEKTIHGARMAEPTRGMDLGDGGELIDDGFGGVPIIEGVSRSRMPKKKPSRKKRLTHYEYMTTVKGFRP